MGRLRELPRHALDPIYWNSVLRSLVFALISTALAMGIAFVLAVLTDRELRRP